MANKRQRANGEGSIMKNIRNGKQIGWRASLTIGRYESGALKRKEFYGKTKKEVQTKLDEYKRQMSMGVLSDDKLTVESWFYTWLFDFRSKDMKPKTFELYEGIYRVYIKDSEIANIKLSDLRTPHLQRYYNKLLDIDKLEISNVNRINNRLKTCLTEAEKQGYIQRNWCKMVTLPKVEKIKEINVLSKDEQIKFIEAIKGNDMELLFLMALGTGLRLGEILGLKWSDIDFKEGTLSVNRTVQRVTDIQKDGSRKMVLIEQTPKTKNSYRTVPIPQNILIQLKIHKKNQNGLILSLGESYQNNNYVLCENTGKAYDPNKPNRRLTSILKANDMDHIKFHGLRHTYATRLFEAGIPPKTVQALMGHSDISLTLDIYTHVMKETKLEAVEKINSIFG